jgi:ribonucleoside-diphosphate reductase alpha chain
MNDAEVPETWSQLATDIMVSKYFRKAGIPQPDGTTGPEKSAKQVIHRLAGCWRHWGEEAGYFDTAADAQAFYDELAHMLTHQMAAPNSPQWFNTGLHWAYGINGPAQGHWYVDAETGQVRQSPDAYTHPQPHACFIQSVDDDLVNDGGIMDLWVREARLFKYGSGTGTNFSKLRGDGEKLAGGGRSSGLMSWLRIGDRAAGAIKSGGTTRRAAKMVCLDLDHPDIEQFVNWKVREELKVAALVEGMKHLSGDQKKVAERLGLKLDYDFNGEAYYTVSGQNSNNSVRIPDAFFDAVDADGDWNLTARTSGKVQKTVKARDLWSQITEAAWHCADPGVQFDSTINAWHTCPASGRINASNPCSEYMFLDNTACNLASINLVKFYDPVTRAFDVERYEHAIDLWTIVLEISVLMAQFPSREIARLSYDFRTLGLGYANIGAVLMQAGIPYDSDAARALCAGLTSILTGRSYRMSALMAKEIGPFAGFHKNRKQMLRVIRNHRRAAAGVARDAKEWEGLKIRPVPIDHGVFASGGVAIANAAAILDRSTVAWDEALSLGEQHGYRNAQTTVIAPTGTIGLLMDCDTTGVEPDFALVKFKKLAGGGYFKIVNQSLPPALKALGYTEAQCADIIAHVLGRLSLDVPMPKADGSGVEKKTLRAMLKSKGLIDADLAAIEASLPTVFEIKFAFASFALSDDALKRVGVDPVAARADQSFNLLTHIGLTKKQIEALNEVVCGTQTVEGAPHLKEAHLAVFDCANTCGPKGTRFIHAEGHIRMMAAAQPFITGAISKTINLPNHATVDAIGASYRLSWELGLKANALYRDGCKLSQPLSTKSDGDSKSAAEPVAADVRLLSDEEQDEDGILAAQEDTADDLAFAAAAAADTNAPGMAAAVARIKDRPLRRRLPDTRTSITHKFNIAGHEGYLTVGLYDDKTPGELFITMSKEGSTIGGLMDSLGTATSVALQYGVPIESLVRKFTHQRFEPAGMTTNREIPFAKSLVDYIFRWMGMQFIPGYREQMAPKRHGHTDDHDDTAGEGATRPAPAAQTVEPRVVVRAERHHERIEATSTTDLPVVGMAGTTVVGGTRSTVVRERTDVKVRAVAGRSALSAALAECQDDAPACEVCGTITVRNGTCYRCLNCGNSMGCS